MLKKHEQPGGENFEVIFARVVSKKHKYQGDMRRRSILSVVMMFLLLFLTSANFFFYFTGDRDTVSAMIQSQGEDSEAFPGSPTGPDEKSPGGPISISEEYLHGHDDNDDPFLSGKWFTHLIAESEKIELVHFELLSPPPES